MIVIWELPSQAGHTLITIGCCTAYDIQMYVVGGHKNGLSSGAYDKWIYSIQTTYLIFMIFEIFKYLISDGWSTGAEIERNRAGH